MIPSNAGLQPLTSKQLLIEFPNPAARNQFIEVMEVIFNFLEIDKAEGDLGTNDWDECLEAYQNGQINTLRVDNAIPLSVSYEEWERDK